MYLGVYFSPPRFPSGTTASGVDLQVSTPATTRTVHVIKRKSPVGNAYIGLEVQDTDSPSLSCGPGWTLLCFRCKSFDKELLLCPVKVLPCYNKNSSE